MDESEIIKTPQEVIQSHLDLRLTGEIERDIAENYAPDVTIIDMEDTYRGHDGVRISAEILSKNIRDASYSYNRVVVEGNVGYLLWSARGAQVQVSCAMDSFVVENGKIVAQTIFYRTERV